MLLTDLITKEHLKWLGDVEWEHYSSSFRLRRRDSTIEVGEWNIERLTNLTATWKRECSVTPHQASCILEHAFVAKLDDLGIQVLHREKTFSGDGEHGLPRHGNPRYTREEAMIALIDELIEMEKENVALAE